jgi:hypothetical protein
MPQLPNGVLGRNVLTTTKSSDIDQELLNYDQYNQSTNDEKSHVGRFNLLSHRFGKFVKSARKQG